MKKLLPSAAVIVDVVERAGATFYETFFALEIADQTHITQLSQLKTAAIAGGLAVGKYLAVKASAFLARPAPPA